MRKSPPRAEISRRKLLARTAGSLGWLAASTWMSGIGFAATRNGLALAQDPLAPKAPHFPARAKRLIFIFLPGGLSHVDSFDYKPELIARDGEELRKDVRLMKPLWDFAPRGESGIEISELFPQLATCADELCLIRSMKTDHGNHFEAVLGMHTGSYSFARPSLGSWLSYGLGSENPNLPSFMVLAPKLPYAGTQNWASDFLPACHQGTRLVPGTDPLPNLKPHAASSTAQERELELLRALNQWHAQARSQDSELQARMRSFETAHAMQHEALELFDLSGESQATLDLYGVRRDKPTGFGWQCLMARRLVERGVRCVELIDVGASGNWDAHGNMRSHAKLARNIDRPIAGLLKDLRGLGLLDDTLVVFTTEFGRTPQRDKPDNTGRGHHAACFSSWLAGGGVKRGHVHGATDEIGAKVAEDLVHLHDFHATILHLMGLDHERLTFHHGGRDYRLTDVAGHVVEKILA